MHGCGVHLHVKGRKHARCIFTMYGACQSVMYSWLLGNPLFCPFVLYSHDGCGVHLQVRGRKHAWCIFSMYGAHPSVMYSLLLGKIPFNPLFCPCVLYSHDGCAVYLHVRERKHARCIFSMYGAHSSVMYSLLLGKIPFNPLFHPCVLYSHYGCEVHLHVRGRKHARRIFSMYGAYWVSCTLYYWERSPSIHCFVFVCFTHPTYACDYIF